MICDVYCSGYIYFEWALLLARSTLLLNPSTFSFSFFFTKTTLTFNSSIIQQKQIFVISIKFCPDINKNIFFIIVSYRDTYEKHIFIIYVNKILPKYTTETYFSCISNNNLPRYAMKTYFNIMSP